MGSLVNSDMAFISMQGMHARHVAHSIKRTSYLLHSAVYRNTFCITKVFLNKINNIEILNRNNTMTNTFLLVLSQSGWRRKHTKLRLTLL